MTGLPDERLTEIRRVGTVLRHTFRQERRTAGAADLVDHVHDVENCDLCALLAEVDRLRGELGSAREWINRVSEGSTDAAMAADAAVARVARLQEALREAHEYHCGCDRPGNPAACVFEPSMALAAPPDTEAK